MKEWKTLTFFWDSWSKKCGLGQFPDLCFEAKYSRVTNTLKYVFIFKPFSNQLNIFVGCNLSFTKSLNASYFEMDG